MKAGSKRDADAAESHALAPPGGDGPARPCAVRGRGLRALPLRRRGGLDRSAAGGPRRSRRDAAGDGALPGGVRTRQPCRPDGVPRTAGRHDAVARRRSPPSATGSSPSLPRMDASCTTWRTRRVQPRTSPRHRACSPAGTACSCRTRHAPASGSSPSGIAPPSTPRTPMSCPPSWWMAWWPAPGTATAERCGCGRSPAWPGGASRPRRPRRPNWSRSWPRTTSRASPSCPMAVRAPDRRARSSMPTWTPSTPASRCATTQPGAASR